MGRIIPYKLFSGAFVPDWLMEIDSLTAGAKLCYAKLAQLSDKETGIAFNCQKALGRCLSVSERQARRYLDELEQQGFIETVRDNRNLGNRYRFLAHPAILEWASKAGFESERTYMSGGFESERTYMSGGTTLATPLSAQILRADAQNPKSELDKSCNPEEDSNRNKKLERLNGLSGRKGESEGKGVSCKKGTRIPENWKPSEKEINYCRMKRPDLDPETTAEMFYNYWMAKTGQDATKLDWGRTWCNWVLNSKPQKYVRKSNSMPTTVEDVLRNGMG